MTFLQTYPVLGTIYPTLGYTYSVLVRRVRGFFICINSENDPAAEL